MADVGLAQAALGAAFIESKKQRRCTAHATGNRHRREGNPVADVA